jgi:hypothetical protein
VWSVHETKKGFKKAVLGRPEGLWAVQKDCVAAGIFSSFFSGYFFFWGVGFGRPIRQCVATGGKHSSVSCAHSTALLAADMLY